MNDDSCVMKYIEIVPLEKMEDCSNVTDVKCEPLSVKVCVTSCFYFIYLVYVHTYLNSNIIDLLKIIILTNKRKDARTELM